MRLHALLLVPVIGALSCHSPIEPTTAAIVDLKYQHVVDFALVADTEAVLELGNCKRGPRDGPWVCLLARQADGGFRCPDEAFMRLVQTLSTECDHTVAVRVRTSTGNPLLLVAHDIFINGTKVTRLSPLANSFGYPQEIGTFGLNPNGGIR